MIGFSVDFEEKFPKVWSFSEEIDEIYLKSLL
jgi:hypothetical protein